MDIPRSTFQGIGAGWAEPQRGAVRILPATISEEMAHWTRRHGGPRIPSHRWPLHRKLTWRKPLVYDPEAISMTPIKGWTAPR